MGDSIIFQPANEDWYEKRKRISVAFYKDKLLKMVEILKESIGSKINLLD